MKNLPKLIQLRKEQDLKDYAQAYEQCSGLPVPTEYLANNKTFALVLNGKMIGGFILGMGPAFRTIHFFASAEQQDSLSLKLKTPEQYTEITCFWLDRKHRSKSLINLMTWVKLAWAIKRHSNTYVLFGTNSRGLARLYNSTSKTFLIHQDTCKNKKTFVFVAQNRHCLKGMFEIILFKIKRMINRARKRSSIPNSFYLKLYQEIPF